MKYFYTNRTSDSKVYVFKNDIWINQLMEIEGVYCWVSLNCCDTNFNCGRDHITRKEAIEDVMADGYSVYQLDAVEELAQFIQEN